MDGECHKCPVETCVVFVQVESLLLIWFFILYIPTQKDILKRSSKILTLLFPDRTEYCISNIMNIYIYIQPWNPRIDTLATFPDLKNPPTQSPLQLWLKNGVVSFTWGTSGKHVRDALWATEQKWRSYKCIIGRHGQSCIWSIGSRHRTSYKEITVRKGKGSMFLKISKHGRGYDTFYLLFVDN